MRRLIAIVLTIWVLVLPAAAADPATGIFQLAQYMPTGADVFVALRADDAYLDALDSVLERANRLLVDLGSASSPQLNVRQILANALNAERSDVDALLTWAGDMIGLSVTAEGDGAPALQVVIPHANRQAADVFIRAQGFTVDGELGSFTAYVLPGTSGIILIGDTVAYVTADSDHAERLVGGDFARLSEDDTFSAAVHALPAESYNAAVYVSPRLAEQQVGLSRELQNGVILGLTLVDTGEVALIADIVQMPGRTPVAQPLSINPEFRRFVPANTSALVQGAELGSLINTAIDTLEANGTANMRANTQALLRGAGLDLSETLNWMKGDFALFGRIDLQGLYRFAVATSRDPDTFQSLFDFGIVIEAVNPAAAAETARGLASALRVLGSGERANVSTETIGGFELTVLRVSTAELDGIPMSLAVALGVNDEVFVFGTYNGVASVLSGEPGIDSASLYSDSAELWLDEPTSVWFVDSNVLAGFVGGLLVFAGPAVQTAYLDIIAVLDEDAPPLEPVMPAPALVDGIIVNLADFSRYATITTSVGDDGVQRLRATITLGASLR